VDWFIEVSDGVKRSTPPKMIKVVELLEWQKQHQTSVQGLFSSVYIYPTDDPYTGGVLSDFYMDLDNEENPDKARREAVAVVKKLISDYDIPEENIAIAFSGMKGISITLDYKAFNAGSSADLPLIWKGIVQELISKLKLKTADTGVYERRRLWRLLNSRHQKTGLYKIPLTLAELENLTIDKIKEMAVKPREPFTKAEAIPVSKAEKLFNEHKNKIEKWLNERKKSFEKTELTILTDDPPCVKTRLQVGTKAGSRNSFLFQLAVYYAHKGVSEQDIILIGHEFAKHCEQQPEPFPKGEEIESIVRSATNGVQEKRYMVGCSSEAFTDLCDRENCPFFQKREAKKKILSPGQDSEDLVFEQAGDEYIVFNKITQDITRQNKVEAEGTFVPLEQIPWKPVTDVQPYDDIWSQVRQYIYEHIDMASGYDILTAWVLATWIPERWDAIPYLFFYGPAGSGKTWALEVLASISFRPFISASTTLPVIFRACDLWHPTLFLDETEVYLRKERSEIMHLLNAGYRKGFPATRIEETEEGLKVKIFDCFGFKALAGTRAFVETLKSRCIVFNMSKATREIKTKIDPERAEELKRKLLLYRFRVLAQKETLEEAKVDLTGRLRELFLPLITVASLGARGSILNEAQKIEEITREEEQAGDEAIVFRAIVSAHEESGASKISIQDIAKIANEGLSPEEMLTPSNVGRNASRLGFKRAIHNKRRCIVWTEDIVMRLKRRYPVEEGQQQF
jgi:hypothetical protein